MPIQAPQWTDFLSCPVCYNEFDENVRRPISLGCGHTVCRMCLGQLHRKQCPFDETEITRDIDELPANFALLQLVGAELRKEQEERLPMSIVNGYLRHYDTAKSCVEDLAWYLKPLGKGGLNNSSATGCILSKPMQRKLVSLVNCQLVEEEGRSRAMRSARSLGERTVTELILQHQNQQQLSANLWAAVRARGCQFLGPAMQEETLKLVLLALEDGAALSRKVLVMFVVQKLEQQFPQASKTSVGHVVQLLYRASCFMVTKRDEESSLMQLKDEFRNYEALRREHDAQIVQIAMEAGLRISPEQWSSLLYGDLNHKSHMQSIIDKLQTPASFATSIQELTIALQRSGDPGHLSKLTAYLDHLAAIDPNQDAGVPSWSDLEKAMVAVKTVVKGLVDFIQNHNFNKKTLEQQTQNIKYKTSMCRDISQKGGCPRGSSCTFAHSEEELERYRAKSRRMLSALNRQLSSQNKASERAKAEKLARGVNDEGLSKEDQHNLMELQQHISLRNKGVTGNSVQQPSTSPVVPSVTCSTISSVSERNACTVSCDGKAPTSSWSSRDDNGRSFDSNVSVMPKSPAQHQPSKQQNAEKYYHPANAPQAACMTTKSLTESDLLETHRRNNQSLANTETSAMASRYVHPNYIGVYSTPVPVYSCQYANNITAHVCLMESQDSKADENDSKENWDMSDGPVILPFTHNQDSVKRTVGAGKPSLKSPQTDPWTIPKDTSLGELCERKEKILHQLRGFSQDESRKPWDRSQSLTKTVTSLWTIPTDSISHQSSEKKMDDTACYNPWTSQAPFCLMKPVKESNTNYTMTFIKAHVRHMSVDEHHNTLEDKPMGTHELSEFKKMSFKDLEHTLKKVKQEDEHAGSCHYERGHKIQLEMDRRVKQQHTEWVDYTDNSPCDCDILNLKAQPELYSHTSDGDRYYQTVPIGAHHNVMISHQGHNPIIKSSRTTFKSTGPIQVNAGPSPETNPVTLTQDCLVAPSFQSSPSEGYHYQSQHSLESFSVHNTTGVSQWPSKISASNNSQQLETDIERQLKNELADLSQEIQKKVLNKNARDIVLLEQATHALDPTVFHTATHNPKSAYETRSDAVIAKQLQEQELEKNQSAHKHNQSASRYPSV